MRLRTKDLLLVSVLTVSIVSMTSLFHLDQGSRILIEGVRDRVKGAIKNVVDVASTELATKASLADSEQLATLIRAQLANVPGLVFLALVDTDGRLVVGSALPERATALPTLDDLLESRLPARIVLLFGRARLCQATVALENDTGPFGTVRAGVDTSLVRASVTDSLLWGLTAMLLGLVCSWVVAVLLTRAGRRPLARLARHIDRIREGEVGVELDGSWDVEVAALGQKLSDLGERFHSERLRLLGENTTLLQIMDSLEDAIVVVDPHERIRFLNGAAAGLLGDARDDLVGRTIEEVLGVGHPLVEMVEDVTDSGHEVRDRPLHLPSPGRFHDSFVTISRLPGDREADHGLVAILEDVGSVHALIDLADAATALAADHDDSAGVVHDLRNPLNTMSLQLTLLEQHLDGAAPAVVKSLAVLKTQLGHLDRMVSGFLDLARVQRCARQRVDVGELLDGITSLLPDDGRVELEFQGPPPAGEVLVTGDADLLHRAFLNVVHNALDAMPDGGRLTIGVQTSDRIVTVMFADTGVGITADDLECVTRPYFTTKSEGVGIGLAVVRRAVEQHGGELVIDSVVGEGTTVTVRLPRVPAPEVESRTG